MIWVLLSVLAGLGDAISYTSLKKLSNLDYILKLALFNLVVLPFLFLGFLFYDIPQVTFEFYIVVIINVIVWLIAMSLMIKSLQISGLSVSVPMLSFTPIFLLFVSYVLLKEFPTIYGLIGIFVIVIGSYILNISNAKEGYFEPFKEIFRSKGILYMLIAAFLFSITATLAKKGINLSNPAYFMIVHYLIASLILVIFLFKRLIGNIDIIKKNFKRLLVLGISTASSELLAATAFKFAIVPYVISLKRTNVIFSALIGIWFLKEKRPTAVILGVIVMFAGVVLITLS